MTEKASQCSLLIAGRAFALYIFSYLFTWITFLSPVQHLQTPFNSSDINTLQYVYVLCTVSYSCGDEIKYVPLTSDFLVFC